MSTSHIQDADIFADTSDGIDFTEDDQTWTVDVGVLVSARLGVAIDSEFDHSTLVNLGTLLTARQTAVIFDVDDGLVSNAIGARIIGAAEGVYVHGARDVVANSGSIIGLTDFAVVLSQASSDAVINNNGTISGRRGGVESTSAIGTSVIHNSGVITSNQVGIDVETADGLTTVITNAAGGVIQSKGGVAIGAADGRVTLNNHGIISGEILLAIPDAANDVIVNHGRITALTNLGSGDDLFNGSDGVQALVVGDEGNDRLIGGPGNDRLNGGPGLDMLTGGPGRDQFVFSGANLSSTTNVDRITDFAPGVDKIDLAEDIFAGLPSLGVLSASRFHVGAAAVDASDRIIYNPNTGFVFYDPDGRGGAAEIHFATLAAHPAIHASDFLVIV